MTDILIADDDVRVRGALRELLDGLGHAGARETDTRGLFAALDGRPADLVLLGASGERGLSILDRIRRDESAGAVVLIDATGGTDCADALRRGAIDLVRGPLTGAGLEVALLRAAQLATVRERLAAVEASRAAVDIASSRPATGEDGPLERLTYADARGRARAHFERSYLEAVLRAEAGNVSAACRRANLDRGTFYRLASRHGIEPRRFRGRNAAAQTAPRPTSDSEAEPSHR